MYEFLQETCTRFSVLIYECLQVTHPDDLSARMVIRIGSLFALDRNSRVNWTKLVNC